MLLELRDNAVLDWQGTLTQSIPGMDIAPRPVQEKLPVWVGVGGTPASFARAGRLGLPLFIALLSGPERFRRLAELYRRAPPTPAMTPAALPVGVGGHFYAAPTSQQARDTFYPHYRAYFEQNMPRPVDHFPRSTFDDWSEPGGGLLVGSPQQVTEKLLEIHADPRQQPLHGADRPRRAAVRRDRPVHRTARHRNHAGREPGDRNGAAGAGRELARGGERNLQESAGSVPAARGPEVPAEPLHPLRDLPGTPARQPCLEIRDQRGMQPKRPRCAAVGVEHENERLVIALERIHRVVVDEVPGAVDDRPVPEQLDAADDVRRVPVDDVGPRLD